MTTLACLLYAFVSSTENNAVPTEATWLSDFLTSKPTIEHFDDNVWLSQGDTVIHLVAEEED